MLRNTMKYTKRCLITPAIAMGFLYAVAQTPNYTVNVTGNGTGSGTLTAAINAANAATGTYVIHITTAGLYQFPQNNSPALQLRAGVVIEGRVSGVRIRAHDANNRVFTFLGSNTVADTTRLINISLLASDLTYNNGVMGASGNNVRVVFDRCTITTRAQNAGVLDIQSGAFVKILNSDISGFTSRNGGMALINGANSRLHIYNTQVHDANGFSPTGTGNGNGAAFRVENGGELWIMDNSEIYHVHGNEGGAVHLSGTASRMIVENSKIYNNRVGNGGGAFRIQQGRATIRNSEITGNFSNSQGGAMRISDCAVVIIESSTISNNTSGMNGGGGIISGSSCDSIIIRQSTMTGNTNGNNAGAGGVGGNGNIHIEGSIITGNTSGGDAPNDIPNTGDNVNIENSVVDTNFVVSNDPTIEECPPGTVKNSQGHCVVEGVIEEDDDGNIVITLPPEVEVPDGGLGGGDVEVQGGNQGNEPTPLTITLSVSDTIKCIGDVITFTATLGSGGIDGNITFRLYKKETPTDVLVGTVGPQSGRTATFNVTLSAASIDSYVVEAEYKSSDGNNPILTSISNERLIITVPVATSTPIGHPKNTTD